MAGTGVFPVHTNQFNINKGGRTAVPADFVIIKNMETFKLSVEGKTEEWYPIDMAGWARQAVTGKKFGVTLTGKRDYGDPGNDYVAGMMMEIGVDCQSQLKWVLPNGATLQFDCVVNVTTPAGGDGTAMDTLEVEILSDGVPTYTPAV